MPDLIEVFLKSLAPNGQLYPVYDPEADVLAVGTRERMEWPYGADIDGNIVFDLTADKIVANFDLLIGRRLWKRRPLHWEWPGRARDVQLGFTDASIAVKSFSIPIEVCSTDDMKLLSVRFGSDNEMSQAFMLSPACVTFVRDSRLTGFLIKL